MPAPSTSLDPRSIVTPEAFSVSPDVLGLPLAPPRKRLGAILIDLVCIGILTVVTRSFALVLGFVIAAALVRASTRRTEVPRNVFDRARRASVGCLGVTVGLVTLIVWVAVRFEASNEAEGDLSSIVLDLGTGDVRLNRDAPPPSPVESCDAQAVRDGVTLYTLEEALDAYVSVRRSGSQEPMDRELLRALEERIATELSSDSLMALEERVRTLEGESRDVQRQLEEAATQLDEAVSSGFLGWLTGLANDLGLGFGWAALYTTVLLTVTNGQTLGKRLTGIRVRRLDGHDITWWAAFERAGGYAAGFATGLLGFAQVYWDANRQAIHDRIVGTVVIVDGAPKVDNWEEAL